MKPVLSYCTAKMFSMSLLPMATMSAPKPVAENDNDRLVPFPAVWGQQAKTSLEGRSRRFSASGQHPHARDIRCLPEFSGAGLVKA